MNVKKIAGNINIKPKDRKMKKARHCAETIGVLPKEMPVEKKIYIQTNADMFEKVKDSIQIALDKFRGQK